MVNQVSSAEEVNVLPPTRKPQKRNPLKTLAKDFRKNWKLHLIALPVVLFFLIFSHLPMVGIVTAFMDYRPSKGIFSSNGVGLQHFQKMFFDPEFWQVFRNTVVMALLDTLLCVQTSALRIDR